MPTAHPPELAPGRMPTSPEPSWPTCTALPGASCPVSGEWCCRQLCRGSHVTPSVFLVTELAPNLYVSGNSHLSVGTPAPQLASPRDPASCPLSPGHCIVEIEEESFVLTLRGGRCVVSPGTGLLAAVWWAGSWELWPPRLHQEALEGQVPPSCAAWTRWWARSRVESAAGPRPES